LIKLDVNFDLPIYDGELHAEKLDNAERFSWEAYALEELSWFGGKVEPKLT